MFISIAVFTSSCLLSMGIFSFSSSDRTIIWLVPKYRTEILTEQFCLLELLLTILLFDLSSNLTLLYVGIVNPAGHRLLCVILLSLPISAVPGCFYIKHDNSSSPFLVIPSYIFNYGKKRKK